eukprot:UN09842
MFRPSLIQRFATEAAQAAIKKPKQTSYVKALFTDTGNIPIVGANLAAASLVVVFGGRKLLFHPDISVADELRKSGDVQNETPLRLDDAGRFRQQTVGFANTIYKPSIEILKTVVCSNHIEDKYSLEFVRKQSIDTPLEHTNWFDDGLYEDAEYTEFSDNKPYHC